MMRNACTLLFTLSLFACDAIDLGTAPRSNVRPGERTTEVTDAPISTPTTPAATPAPSAPSRWLHTRGAKIVDASGAIVRLTGISWFGFETSTFAPHGLWKRPLEAILDDVAALGYNMLRVPFATQMLDAGSMPSGIDFAQNPALAGKTPLEVLDALIAGAAARGLRVVLDRHRPDAEAQSALWYTAAYSEARWIDDWKMLAQRYAKDPTVIGFDLHNEPHGAATWGSGELATDWRLAAERAGAAVQAVNPELLVFVEGVETVLGQGTWWGGNLRAAKQSPVRLPVANHVVYSPHEYPASVAPQPWLSAPDFPANLPAVWDETWGYLVAEDLAPVWIGELGTKYETPGDQTWLGALASYIARTEMSFAFWCLNPDSSTGGILKGDWRTTEASKQAMVAPILAQSLH